MGQVEMFLKATSLILLFGGLVVCLAGATELGRMVGRRLRRRDIEDKESGTLATGMLGIFALLIAFTYSLALSRYDARRQVVLEEANASGTSANYAAMLPPAHRQPIEILLRNYTQSRIDLGSPWDIPQFTHDLAVSNGLLTQLWSQANAVTAEAPQSLPAYRFVASLNETTNIAEARVTALRNHVPVVVPIVLAIVGMISLGFAGYSTALTGIPRYMGLTIMALTLALLMTLTLDLDRPNRGTITISVQPLVDALTALPAT